MHPFEHPRNERMHIRVINGNTIITPKAKLISSTHLLKNINWMMPNTNYASALTSAQFLDWNKNLMNEGKQILFLVQIIPYSSTYQSAESNSAEWTECTVIRAGSHDIAIQFSGLYQLLQFLKFLSQLLQLLCNILRSKK